MNLGRPRTHEENRQIVCLVCMKKLKSLDKISPKMVDDIKTFFVPNFALNSDCFHSVICITCRMALKKGVKNNERDSNFIVYDHSNSGRVLTRSKATEPYEYYICQVARTHATSSNFQKTKKGRPTASKNKNEDSPIIKLCKECMVAIGPGIRHKCNKLKRVGNLLNLSTQSSPKLSEKLASSIVKNKVNESKENDGQIKLTTNQNRESNLVLKQQNPNTKIRRNLFSVEDISAIQI